MKYYYPEITLKELHNCLQKELVLYACSVICPNVNRRVWFLNNYAHTFYGPKIDEFGFKYRTKGGTQCNKEGGGNKSDLSLYNYK